MSHPSNDRTTELRELFFETSQELLQALNEEAMKLEKKPGDSELVRSIRRTVHTLKGDSAACGFRELSELAHDLEDVLALEIGAGAHPEVAEVVELVHGPEQVSWGGGRDRGGDVCGHHRSTLHPRRAELAEKP